MPHRHDPVRVSRRTALGAAAAAGAALGGGRHALAAPSDSRRTDQRSVLRHRSHRTIPEADPAPTTPGTRYISLAGIDFKPFAVVAPTYDSDFGDLRTASGGGFTAPVVLPHGARITEMVVYATRPDADNTIVRLVCHRSSLGDTGFLPVAPGEHELRPSPSPLVQTYTVAVAAAAVGAVVDERASAYFVIVNAPCRRHPAPLGRQDRVRDGGRRPVLPDQPGPRLRLACGGPRTRPARTELQSSRAGEGQPRQRQRRGPRIRRRSGRRDGDRLQPHGHRHHRSELPRPHAWATRRRSRRRRSTGPAPTSRWRTA